MIEDDAEESNGRDLDGGGLQDQIGHWMAVLDRWIKQFDQGMGGQEAATGSLESVDGRGGSSAPVDDYGRDPLAGPDS